jgi:hypothetical protein
MLGGHKESISMMVWIRPTAEMSWTRYNDTVVAMAMLVSRPESMACIQASNLDACKERLRAMMLILRKAGFEPNRIIVSTDHPSIEHLAPLADDGVGYFQLVERTEGSRPEGTPEAAAALLARLCPALHCRSFDGTGASTCARHGDRMLVGRQHMRRWCTGRFEDCPHRMV